MIPPQRPLITERMRENLGKLFDGVIRNSGYKMFELAFNLMTPFDQPIRSVYKYLGDLRKGRIYGFSDSPSGGPHRIKHAYRWAHVAYTCNTPVNHSLVLELRALEPDYFKYPPKAGIMPSHISKNLISSNLMIEDTQTLRVTQELRALSQDSYDIVATLIHHLHKTENLERCLESDKKNMSLIHSSQTGMDSASESL